MSQPNQPPTTSEPTFMDPALLPWVLVSELYWMSYKLLERRIYDLGVSVSQARVLMVLHHASEPINPSAIATLLFRETQSIIGVLQRIEARGWITRMPDAEDGRAVLIQLTEAGRSVTTEIDQNIRDVYAQLFGSVLTASEKRQVASALRKARAAAFRLPETDFKLRRAQRYAIWKD